jgi:CheY-like chemotaxis protein
MGAGPADGHASRAVPAFGSHIAPPRSSPAPVAGARDGRSDAGTAAAATSAPVPVAGVHGAGAGGGPERVRVLVADDHPVFRQGIVRALEQTGRAEIVAEAADGRTALAQIRERQPDVAVLDLRMPGLDGIEIVRALAADGSAVATLLLSAFTDPPLVSDALAAGATGYVGKDAEREEICRAVLDAGRERRLARAGAPGGGPPPVRPPRTVLMHHDDGALEAGVLARWLASFSDLAGIVVLAEPRRRVWERLRHERRRVGAARLLDVAAFRLYARLFLAGTDRAWERRAVRDLEARYPALDHEVPVLRAASPNTPEVERFIAGRRPDLMIARSRTLLDEPVFSLPVRGTYVMHPGITPEYRNSHGCFWALANHDHARVGMTLLRVDAGVDTGPVYGYYSYPYDERTESHAVIQKRVVLENLDAVRDRLLDIHRGEAAPLDTAGRTSAVWGQPWLTSYLRWKWHARQPVPTVTTEAVTGRPTSGAP